MAAGDSAGPLYRSLADRLRFARRIAGMTQRDLAAAIGVRGTQVGRYETGAAAISAATLLRMAVVLDVPVGWLYGVEDSDNWPDTLLAELFRDPQMPALVSSFRAIPDDRSRRLVLDLAGGLAARAPRRMAEKRSTDAAPPPPVPVPADGPRPHALLVDDAPDVLVVVGAFLRSGGFDVTRAPGAGEALEILGGDAPVDVLVTDYAMPDMSGLELVRRAGQLRPGLGAVMITVFAADLAVKVGQRPGLVILSKPFARGDLLNAVRAVLAPAAAGMGGH
jgi:CheY-like chemotaxis protein/transcriptional regulator with XRE-family HTH domain